MAGPNEPVSTTTEQDQAEADRLWAEMDALDTNKETADAGADAAAQAIEDSHEWPADPAAPAATEEATRDAVQQPAPAADDPWANATPAQLAERDRLKRELENSTAAQNRWRGRARKLSELQKLAEPRPAATAALERLTTARNELKERNSEYPELVDPIDKALESVQESVKDLNALEEERRSAAQADVADALKTEADRFLAVHPDAVEVFERLQGNEFLEWMLNQPVRIREAYYTNQHSIVDADAAIVLADAVKAHLGIAAQIPAPSDPTPQPIPALSGRRERQLSGLAAPANNRRQPTPAGVPKSGLTDQEMWDALEAEEQAKNASMR